MFMAEDEMLSNPFLLFPENRIEADAEFSPPTEAAEAARLDRFREVLLLAAAPEYIPLASEPRALPLPTATERASGADRSPFKLVLILL
jgi:hypothetical protein